MKKILFIFSFLFCALFSMAQTFPNNTTQGNVATLTNLPGAVNSAYKLRQFSDTASANAALYLQFTPHLMIKVGNNIYVRNTAATQWILIGGNFILNPGVDSVTLYGNTLCQWVSGVSTCYALNNSTFSTYATKGDFIYDSLLYFHNTPYQYYILGRYFTAPYTSHLLTPVNPSAARNDVAFVDTLSSASIITGVNGGGIPSTNPVSQLKIGEIHINANDTIPSNFSNDIVYRFNNEWSPTSSISGIDFAYATSPFTGTSVSTYVPSFTNGETISYTRDTARDFSTASYLKFRIWLNASFTSANLNFSFNKAGNVATTTVPLLNGQFGYSSTTVGSWQEVNIPMAYFQYFDYYIDELVVGMTGANASGFKIGNIVIQFGGNPPPSSSSTGIIAVNGNYGPYVNFQYIDTGYVDVDTSNYVYKDRQTGTVLFTLPTYLKNLVSNRTPADTCIVLDTLGRTIFISFNQNCGGSGGGGSGWLLTGNAGTTASSFIGPTNRDSFQIKINGLRSGFWDNIQGNYGIGYNTFISNTTGNVNTAMGGATLAANTEGSENSAFGESSMIQNLTGSSNSAFGYESLSLNTTGFNNSAFGKDALLNNTTGYSNVGIGYYAGKYNVPGAASQVFINSINRVNYLGDTTASPIWIQQNATVASQRIKLNGMVITPVDAYINTVQAGRGTTTRGADSLNLLIGRLALSSNTTGYRNIAIGDSALKSNTTAISGVAIGFGALKSNTTGFANLAIGFNALSSNTTSQSNTAIGYENLAVNTSGQSNTAIGYHVLLSNTSGTNNTGIGQSTLANHRVSDQNTAIGSNAMGADTSGAKNTAIGYDAMRLNLSGNYNVAIGNETFRANKTGSNNTAIGDSALNASLSGDYNVAIGKRAGSISLASSHSITMGADAIATSYQFTMSDSITGMKFKNIDSAAGTAPSVIGKDGAGLWHVYSTPSGGGGTVTNIATGLGLSGGPITTTGTLLVDTSSASILSRQRAAATYQLIGNYAIGDSAVWQTKYRSDSARTNLYSSLSLKAPLASPTFTGTVTIPTPFTLGATSVTSTGTQLNYLNAATGTTGTASTNLVFSTSPTIATPVFTSNITTPIILGGSSTTQTLIYRATSGNGATGADHIFQVGNSGAVEAMRIYNSGNVNIKFKLGINVDPPYNYSDPAFQTTTANAQFGSYYIQSVSLNNGFITNNATFDGSVLKIKATGLVSAFQLANGKVILYGGKTGGTGVTATFNTGVTVDTTGRVGIMGVGTPTAALHLPAGTATASTAPLKLTSGTNLTTVEAGAVEFDGTNYFASASTTRYTLAKTLTATATLDFGSTLAGAVTDLTITVTGAADGDAVTIGVPNGSYPATGTFNAWVSAANTVTIRYANNSLTLTQDPASGTFRASVIKY